MHPSFILLVGLLFAIGFYLVLRRSLVQLFIGLVLLSHGANLLVFISSGLVSDAAPILSDASPRPISDMADPLPQALVLTAIVISFGVLAFSLILFRRAWDTTQTDDLDDLTETDR